MREAILLYIKNLENFEGMSPCHAIFPQTYKILACMYFFVKILNISIKSPRSLLYFKVSNLSFLILSSYVKSLKPGMSLVAHLGTFSITSTWLLNLRAQTELVYSKCGLTNALYRRRKDSLSRCMNDRPPDGAYDTIHFINLIWYMFIKNQINIHCNCQIFLVVYNF